MAGWEGQQGKEGQRIRIKEVSLSQLSLSCPHPATRNAADWWLSHWISQLKAAKNSSQEVSVQTPPDSAGLLSAQLLLFFPRSF